MADDVTPASRAVDPSEYEALPWHTDVWQRLMKSRARLPHALLLRGQEGLGKQVLALRLARTLLCRHATEQGACGRCQGCHLVDTGNHPDLLWVTLDDERTTITVEQIRALADFLSLKPHSAPHKVVLLMPADLMNPNAANALLKLLEEPPLGSMFVLVSSRPMRLPATIRSRCVPIAFRPPSAAVARQWLSARLGRSDDAALAAAGGAPFLAERLAQTEAQSTAADARRDLDRLATGEGDPVRIAAQWKTAGSRATLAAARYHVAARIRCSVVADNPEINDLNIKPLLTFLHVLDYAYSQIGTPIDETLLLEETLIRWADLHAEPIVYTDR